MGETESGIVCGLPSEDSGSSCRQRVAKERTRLASVHNDDIRGVPFGLIEHLVILSESKQRIRIPTTRNVSTILRQPSVRSQLEFALAESARQASPALAVVLLRHAHIVVAIRTFRLVACDLDLCRLIFAGQLCSLRGLGERRGLRYGRLHGLRNYGCRHRRRWHGLRCGNFRWRYSLLRQALRIIAKPPVSY